MTVMLFIGLALVVIFAMPWYRTTRGESMFVLPWYRGNEGQSSATGFGCLAQALFWLGAFITATAVLTRGFEIVLPSPVDRRDIAVAIEQHVFRTQQPLISPGPVEILAESAEILSQWQLVMILGLFGFAFGVTAERMAYSSLTAGKLTLMMTAILFFATTVLVLTTGSLMLGTGGIREGFADEDLTVTWNLLYNGVPIGAAKMETLI
jgi:hypothetical protein